MIFESIETERLILRKLGEEEYRLIFEHHSDAEIMAFLNIETAEGLAIEKVKYKRGYSSFNKSFLFFQIMQKDSGNIIGWCGYHTWYLDHGRAEIGYGLVTEDVKGKGIMSEALDAILPYGFNEMQLSRIEAFIGPGNIPSLKLISKFGFTREGQLREHYAKNGRLEDSVVFSLLKREYDQGKQNL